MLALCMALVPMLSACGNKTAEPDLAPEEPAEDDGDKALEDMTVGDLRRKARGVEGFPLTKQEIKFAKKDELLEAFAKVE